MTSNERRAHAFKWTSQHGNGASQRGGKSVHFTRYTGTFLSKVFLWNISVTVHSNILVCWCLRTEISFVSSHMLALKWKCVGVVDMLLPAFQDDLRVDGRGCEDYRHMEIETDVVSNTDGSSKVTLVISAVCSFLVPWVSFEIKTSIKHPLGDWLDQTGLGSVCELYPLSRGGIINMLTC